MLGLFVAAGCGGRTGMLGDGFTDPDGSGADGGGADGHAGRGGAGNTAGRRGYGGAQNIGGYGPVGGSGVYPGGAYYGGSPGYSGGYPVGGYGFGGYAYGGAYAYGGTFNSAGFPNVGGFGYGGNPSMPGGNCCRAQNGPSCRPRTVAQCVCASAPYCCEKIWDQGCANLIEPLGCGYCERDNCESCLNRSCGGELSQCFQDFGCLSIFSCTQASGCEAFQCYTDAQCKGVIDQWGGPGSRSMSLLLTAYSCAIQSGCPCN
jgi:hypothetical protein